MITIEKGGGNVKEEIAQDKHGSKSLEQLSVGNDREGLRTTDGFVIT